MLPFAVKANTACRHNATGIVGGRPPRQRARRFWLAASRVVTPLAIGWILLQMEFQPASTQLDKPGAQQRTPSDAGISVGNVS